MKKIFLLMVIAILIESTFLPLPLVLSVIFIVNYYWEETSPEMLFIYGLLLDLFSMRLLGLGSLIFLSFYLINSLYAKKIQNKSLLFQIFIYIIFIFIYNLLYYSLSNLVIIFWEIAIGLSVLFFCERIFPTIKEKNKKLNL